MPTVSHEILFSSLNSGSTPGAPEAAIDTTRSGALTRHEGKWHCLIYNFCEKLCLFTKEEEVRDEVEAPKQDIVAIEMTLWSSACSLGTVPANNRNYVAEGGCYYLGL